MKVEIGYAVFADAGGSTIEAELSFPNCAVCPAAAIVFVDGRTNVPARFWTSANVSFAPTAFPIAT